MKAIWLDDEAYKAVEEYIADMRGVFSDEERMDYSAGDEDARSIADIIAANMACPPLPDGAWRGDISHCPKCGGEDIEQVSFDELDGVQFEYMLCHETGFKWTNVYFYAYSFPRN